MCIGASRKHDCERVCVIENRFCHIFHGEGFQTEVGRGGGNFSKNLKNIHPCVDVVSSYHYSLVKKKSRTGKICFGLVSFCTHQSECPAHFFTFDDDWSEIDSKFRLFK